MADVHAASDEALQLKEERERCQKMKQENQVLLKKLHDVVARYRQLQQQYQSLVEQQAAQGSDTGGSATSTTPAPVVADELTKEHDQAVKKLEMEKHELIEKLKQVVGTCRVMQKQLQEVKEENEALKSPAKPMLSVNDLDNEDSATQHDALQRRIVILEQDLADKEVERQELVGKMKEVISRYQTLQKQLEEKMGEHDAATSKVAALELELRTRQTNEETIKERDRAIATLTSKVDELTLSIAQEEARSSVLREENERLKEQLTAILDEKRRSEAEQRRIKEELEEENSSLDQKVKELEQSLEIMRKQQDDAEQMYVEVASKLNQTLRDNGELHGRVESLSETIEILERQVTDSNALHKIEVRRLQDEKEVAITGEGSNDPEDMHELQRRLIQLEREMEMIGIGSEYLSLADVVAERDELAARSAEWDEQRASMGAAEELAAQRQERLERLEDEIMHLQDEIPQLRDLENEMKELKEENKRMVFEVAKTTDAGVKWKQDYEDIQSQLKDKQYLKNVVIKYIESQNQSEKDRLIPVIATVLHFSPQEMKKINDAQQKAQEESVGILGGVFSLFGGSTAAPPPKPLAIPIAADQSQPPTGMITSSSSGLDLDEDDGATSLNPFASTRY
ncbi:hypothetical protein ATCC90586_004225 [Pythium insidiosum]|nr:hypothetical protein ATCC90586_004225 [Pythium insidiosum]